MKKILLVSTILFIVIGLSACGQKDDVQKNNTQTTKNIGNKTITNQIKTRQQMKGGQKAVEEIKNEVLKVQMDKTLTKKQKAEKVQALQEELKANLNKVMGK